MERQGFDLPLLIGGANHQRGAHRGERSTPTYRRGQTVYVNDASRAVGVAQNLMSNEASARTSPTSAPSMRASPRRHARGEANKQRLSLKDRAQERSQAQLVGATTCRPRPGFLGTKVLDRLFARGAHPLHRLDAVLRHLGADRKISGDPRRPPRRGGGALAFKMRRRCCRRLPTSVVPRRRRGRVLAG